MNEAIGIDIGGTKIAAGVVSETGEVFDLVQRSTPSRSEQIPELLASMIEPALKEYQICGVGIGAAGFINVDRTKVRFSPNIDWIDEPLAQQLAQRIDCPVAVENDANAAAWGEFRFGAGREVNDLLMITVGTGIGGGLIHAGRLFRGSSGAAGEIGHMRLVPDGRPCGCGQRGCFEQYGSGSALEAEARERLSANDPMMAALKTRAGKDSSVDGRLITEMAKDGDGGAKDLLKNLGEVLGTGLASLSAVLDPSLVVIGGGVAEAGELLLAPTRGALAEHMPASRYRPIPQIVAATLGNTAGLIGAADLVRSEPFEAVAP